LYRKNNGVFQKLGEQWLDDYWINYGRMTITKNGKQQKITKLRDYLEFKGCDPNLANPVQRPKKGGTND
jgi:hypothetical protein